MVFVGAAVAIPVTSVTYVGTGLGRAGSTVIDERPIDTSIPTGGGANALATLSEGVSMILIGATVAVGIGPIANIGPGLGRAGSTAVHLPTIAALQHAGALTHALATGGRRDRVIFVDPPITIGVDPITDIGSTGRLSRLAGVPYGPAAAQQHALVGAEPHPTVGHRLRVILVHSTVTVAVVPVADIGAQLRGSRLTGVGPIAVDTDAAAFGGADPHSAGGVGAGEAFVAAAITVLIAGIALIVCARGAAGFTLIRLHAPHADTPSRRRALALTTLNHRRAIALVNAAIAIVVASIAVGIVAARGLRPTPIDEAATHTLGHAHGGANAHATRGVHGPHIFVNRPIAVFVGPVAAGVIVGGLASLAGVAHAPGGTQRPSNLGALPFATGRWLLDEALVHATIAVGVEAITGGVTAPGWVFGAVVGQHPIDTATHAIGLANADAAGGGFGGVVFVRLAVTVVVCAVTIGIVAGGFAGSTAVADPPPDTALGPLGLADADPTLDGLTDEIFVFAPIAVIVDPVARHVFGRAVPRRTYGRNDPLNTGLGPDRRAGPDPAFYGGVAEPFVGLPVTVFVYAVAGVVVARWLTRLAEVDEATLDTGPGS